MSVNQAQRDIDSAEFAEWVAFHNLEPFTVNREEYVLAIIASILANTNRKKGTKAFSPEDFIPKFTKESSSRRNFEDPKTMEHKLRVLLHGYN